MMNEIDDDALEIPPVSEFPKLTAFRPGDDRPQTADLDPWHEEALGAMGRLLFGRDTEG